MVSAETDKWLFWLICLSKLQNALELRNWTMIKPFTDSDEYSQLDSFDKWR